MLGLFNRVWGFAMSVRSGSCLFALGLTLALPLAWLASAPAPLAKPAKGLYSDAQVRAVAGCDLDRLQPGEESPWLRVVPDGGTRPLGETLKALGFEVTRLQQPEVYRYRCILTLSWRVSPSYDLHCVLERANPDDPFDLANDVCAVEILKRPEADAQPPQAPGK
jgi:hypothetical protein